MTRDEERAIEHECARLIALYANLGDSAEWDEVAALFTDDGRMSRPSAPDDWIEGRAAIVAMFRERPPRKARHLCANVVIEVISEVEARGETALALFVPDRAPKLGSFHDRFVKYEAGWKFAERRGSMLF